SNESCEQDAGRGMAMLGDRTHDRSLRIWLCRERSAARRAPPWLRTKTGQEALDEQLDVLPVDAAIMVHVAIQDVAAGIAGRIGRGVEESLRERGDVQRIYAAVAVQVTRRRDGNEDQGLSQADVLRVTRRRGGVAERDQGEDAAIHEG